MKVKLLLFLTISIIPNLLFAQYIQQGLKLVGTGEVGVGNAKLGNSVAISSDGNTAIAGGFQDNISAGAVWVFTRSGESWVQQGPKLVGTGAVGGRVYQGVSVSISSDGNTVIEGGYGDNDNSGAAWIFTRTGGIWTQQGPKLVGTGSGGAHGGFQGSSVAISPDGNTAILGGSGDNNYAGAVWIFTRSSGVWTQQGSKLVAMDAGGNAGFGASVSISSEGNTAIMGGPLDNNFAGASWVFTRTGGVWTQQGPKLFAAGTVNAGQGFSVAISADGNTAIEGSPNDNGREGCVSIFIRSGGVWTQQSPVLVGSGSINSNIGGVGDNVFQGCSVAISPDGNTAVEGGSEDNRHVGAVWVFTRTNGVWSQLGSKLVGKDTVGTAIQGYSVGISSDGTIIEGGYYDNNEKGAVWVFTNQGAGITTNSNETQKDFSLSQNYPNPFNPSTVIKFHVHASGFIKLVIYDVFGKEAATIVNEHLDEGTHESAFDGSKIPGGTYFYKLQTDGYTEMKKMTLIK